MSHPLTMLGAARLRKSLGAKLASEAKRKGVPADRVRKQYIFTILLSRLFKDLDTPWVLLGGNALLIRTGGGRFTKDIDLARQGAWPSAETSRAELQKLANKSRPNDPFEFDLYSVQSHREADSSGYGVETAKVKARALLAGVVFEEFSIDITMRRHADFPVDYVPLGRVIEHETLRDLPAVPTSPIEHHLADKICALYELHGSDGISPSNRYRDLADVVRIIAAIPIDASRLTVVLEREAGRRQLRLPNQLKAPGSSWVTGFPAAAASFAEYPVEYRNLEAALSFSGNCLNEVLDGSRTTGTWDPSRAIWTGGS